MKVRKISFLFVFVVLQLAAAEFTIRIVDGLGRPVPAVNLEVYCDSKTAELRPLQFMSDQDGAIHGTYDEGMCKPPSVSIEKQGYQSYFTGFRDRYILQRVLSEPDLPRIVRLPADELQRELSEALAGDPSSDRKFADSIFYYEAQLRPALWTLARQPELTLRVRQMLSMIAAPEDLHLIMKLDAPPTAGGFGDRWRYQVATSLVNPDREEEWSFLRRCAFNEFNDRWVDAGAIQEADRITTQPDNTRGSQEGEPHASRRDREGARVYQSESNRARERGPGGARQSSRTGRHDRNLGRKWRAAVQRGRR
jgi:hypothetical protein